jgi:hypothetical protein
MALRELLDRGYGRAPVVDDDTVDGKRVIIEYRWGDDTTVDATPALPAPPQQVEVADGDPASAPAIATPGMVIRGTIENDVVWAGPSSVRKHDKLE